MEIWPDPYPGKMMKIHLPEYIHLSTIEKVILLLTMKVDFRLTGMLECGYLNFKSSVYLRNTYCADIVACFPLLFWKCSFQESQQIIYFSAFSGHDQTIGVSIKTREL